MARKIFLAAALAGLCSAATIRVKFPQSIQLALDSAQSGDTVVVENGTYPEQLLITKSGVELVGKNKPVLVPPPTPVINGCTGLAGNDSMGVDTNAGICILGKDVTFEAFKKEHKKVLDVGTRVAGVTVKGFEVKGFSGLNIAVVGAMDATVRENTVSDAASYGILTVGSVGTLITRNTVKSSDLKFIGICQDDKSDVTTTQNVISDHYIGLCVQTHGADIGHNKVSNCCIAVFVDPKIDGAQIRHNKVGASHPWCAAKELGGFAAGIVLGGATNALVRNNEVSGISDGNNPMFPDNVAAGIVIYDDLETPSNATGNVVTFNTVYNNELDIRLLSAGNNKIKHNNCTTPANICSNQ